MTSHPLANWTSSTSAGSPMPDTVMAHAFVRAIFQWAERQNPGRRVTLPSGSVDGDELRQVVCALACSRSKGSIAMAEVIDDGSNMRQPVAFQTSQGRRASTKVEGTWK